MQLKNIAKIAPVIATAIGGAPGGLIAEGVSQLILGSKSGKPEEIDKALESASFENIIKLQQMEQDYKLSMAKLQNDDMQRASTLAEQDTKHTASKLAYLIYAGFYAVIAVIFILAAHRVNIDPDIETVLGMLLGTLATAFNQANHLFLGQFYRQKELPKKEELKLPEPFK